MKSKVTVITPTGDRSLAFDLCRRWMKSQTRKPDEWIVVDDGKIPLDISSIIPPDEMGYIRRAPRPDDPKHTLALNLRVAIPLVTGDRILIMEDDEYYAPGYIDAMVRALDDHLIAGIKNAKYYHLPTGGYYQNHNDRHASLAETAFRAAALPEVYALIAENDDPFIDIKIWKKYLAQGKLFDDSDRPLYVGMKGLPGRPGIGGGHKENLYRNNHDSADKKILKSWCPRDYQVYIDIMSSTLKGKEKEVHLKRVPVDIIVPTYNNEDLTITCFESLRRCTDPDLYRLIWVDNASRDTAKVEQCIAEVNHVSVRLSANVGFVGAVNRGIELSNSDFVCLLNNDTVLSTGWLEKLLAVLKADPQLGIVGPVTAPLPIPNMGSYPKGTPFYYMQKNYDSHHNIRHIEDNAHRRIFPDYNDLENFNRKIEVQFDKTLADCAFVAFLCAAIKREVIDKVGLLDTAYAFGLYDDSDYNMAVRRAGYKTKLLYSTCIYHRGRSTFDMVRDKEHLDVDALLKRNHAILKRKWAI